MRYVLLPIAFLFSIGLFAQPSDSTSTLSLLFMGDIMGHDTQIASALQPDNTYDYTEVFSYIKDEISSADVSIANLEVTLAGPPFKGYPQFSSPDALAVAVKQAGIDVLGTANNHCVDRGKKGLLRTIRVLDSLNIPHMGTYSSADEKNKNTPLIIEKKGFKLALLNYTYGTNGIPIPEPAVVNIIDYGAIKLDIEKAKAVHPDKIIMLIHWGTEYEHKPNKNQRDIAEFCFKNGVDYIIGSHPHVIQPSEWINDSTVQDRFITWSLGNFISNQRKQYTDGGQMIKLVLQKQNHKVNIIETGYFLTWVYTPIVNNKRHFYILPCAKYELDSTFFISPEHFNRMKLFISDSRNLLNTNNINVGEYIYYQQNWVTP